MYARPVHNSNINIETLFLPDKLESVKFFDYYILISSEINLCRVITCKFYVIPLSFWNIYSTFTLSA